MVRRQHESNLLVVLLLIQPGVSSRCDGTFLTRVQLYIHQDLQVLLYKADFQLASLQFVLLCGVTISQVQDFAFAFLNFMMLLSSNFSSLFTSP